MGTNIELSVTERVSGAVRMLLTGKAPKAWFGPNQPVRPVAQEARGRALDYPVAVNLRQWPRNTENISFEHLRGLADGCDILRLVLETRKDQVEAIDWEIVKKDADSSSAKDSRAKELTEFFLQPSAEHDWSQWLRAIMEDVLVMDAVAVFPRYTRGGDLYSLDLLDPGTIKRVIDDTGRTPMPPDPAYQQVLKGVPAVNYHADELYYFMRNPRTHKLYGYSPVEQVIVTVNTAIRKALHQLQYYTEGNIPEALAAVPESWTTDQIAEFQLYWDSLMVGDTAKRRRLTFVPIDPTKMKETKQVDLKDQYDEWLARVICYAFSVSPSALVKDSNRATAETVAEQARMEGLIPLLRFLKARMDHILRKYIDAGEYEFRWKLEEKIDATSQATVDKTYVEMKVLTPDEVREERFNKPKLTPEEKEAAWPTPAPEVGPDGEPIPGAPGAPGGGKVPGKPAASANEADRDAKNKAEAAAASDEQAEKVAKAILSKMPAPKIVVAPTINVPPQQAPRVDVNVGDVEIHADLRAIDHDTAVVSKTVRASRSVPGDVHGTILTKQGE
jgi:hypothetical protein